MLKNREENEENSADSSENQPKAPKSGLFELGKRGLGAGTVSAPAEAQPFASLDSMELGALLELRGEIDQRLPARSLADLDLEEELLLQFARTKQLYDAVTKDKSTPANQKAQVANSCTTILDQLAKMQGKIFSAERNKALEHVLIRTLKTLPEAAQREFFERYELALEQLGLPPVIAPPAPAAA
jgi:hypothetical protein